MPRRRRQPSEQLLITCLIALFAIAVAGLIALVVYGMVEHIGRALGQ